MTWVTAAAGHVYLALLIQKPSRLHPTEGQAQPSERNGAIRLEGIETWQQNFLLILCRQLPAPELQYDCYTLKKKC